MRQVITVAGECLRADQQFVLTLSLIVTGPLGITTLDLRSLEVLCPVDACGVIYCERVN